MTFSSCTHARAPARIAISTQPSGREGDEIKHISNGGVARIRIMGGSASKWCAKRAEKFV